MVTFITTPRRDSQLGGRLCRAALRLRGFLVLGGFWRTLFLPDVFLCGSPGGRGPGDGAESQAPVRRGRGSVGHLVATAECAILRLARSRPRASARTPSGGRSWQLIYREGSRSHLSVFPWLSDDEFTEAQQTSTQPLL